MRTTFWAPGRVNLIGEHTDYSGGLVLPMAIDRGITVSVELADLIVLKSEGVQVVVGADGRGAVEGWGRYVGAVARELAALGRKPAGMRGLVESDLPQGAGLGSSGAFEVGVALALCHVAGFQLDPLELALACQRSEHKAVGVPSGILDQAASLLGRAGNALLLDCGSLDHRWIPLPEELAVLVVDSGERHAHEGSGYGDCRRELEAGVAARVRHVTSENERVRAAAIALERGDVQALGELFAASHASLRDDYEVSTPTLDAVVEAALAAGAFGARMTGGGFGGSVVALAESDRAQAVLASTLERIDTQGWIVRPSDGATRRRTDSLPDPA